MKNKISSKKLFGKKSVILAAVSLVLVMMMAVGATVSWIEDVSQVEFNTADNAQGTPVHVGSKVLKSDVEMKSVTGDNATGVVNLSDYFYESGDMHLSPCYGDGENFYFPVEKKNTGSMTFRTGTKDDANVNYLSATFRIRSSDAGTAYWFEKSSANTPFISFKNGTTASTNTALTQYLRCSVTIDGATNVYALNSNGLFKTVSNNAVSTKNGRRIDQYSYYSEAFNNNSPEVYYKNTSANVTNKPNQGAGSNLNGNTLFNVAKYDTQNNTGMKTVTVKIWLEYNALDSNVVNLASINMNFVSSWAKTRRIYVKDATVHQEGFDSHKWLGTYSAKLYWGLKDDLDTHWQMTKVSDTDYYYVDIPAVYNNVDSVFFRCSGSGWNNGDKTYSGGNKNITCWNYWETAFPDTFHSEVYTVYSTDFGTWEDASKVNSIYFINSESFSTPRDYMWDSKSEHGTGINDKVVKNADWPGISMTTIMKTKTKSQSFNPYAFFYNSDYDKIIFSDGFTETGLNREFQTQDLWLTDNEKGKTFDMATLTWFNTYPGASDWDSKIPSYSASNTYIHGNFVTGERWVDYRFAYGGQYASTEGNAFNGSSSTHMLCKIYIKAAGTYEFGLNYGGVWYGAYTDGDKRVCPYNNYYVDGTLIPNNYGVQNDDNHRANFTFIATKAGIVRIYFDTNEMKLYFADGEN